MDSQLILTIIQSFYDRVKKDVLIGYHFRFIEDFESHIPRIADFWNLQINGELTDKGNLPFKLIQEHKDRGIKPAEMGRWVTIFKENLEAFEHQKLMTKKEKDLMLEKVEHFRTKIEMVLFN